MTPETKDENGLLPCMCGKRAGAQYLPRPNDNLIKAPWAVACFTCGTTGSHKRTKEQAIEAWNTRAYTATLREMLADIERLRDALDNFVTTLTEYGEIFPPDVGTAREAIALTSKYNGMKGKV